MSAVQVSGLVKTFRGFAALDGLDLAVERGEVHGFLGPNGAGKSTTIRVLLGLFHRDAGDVAVLGRDPGADPLVTRDIAYVAGDVALWPGLTGQQVLDALAGLRGRRDEAAEARLVEAFALDPRRRVRAMSKGNRQKVALVAAFAAPVELLILDEPTSGLDPLMEEVFQGCVRDAAAAGRTVLLSSHILAEVEKVCDAVTIVKDGRTVESGRLADLRHLAASRVGGVVPAEAAERLRAVLPAATVSDAGRVDLAATGDDVPRALQALVDAGAREITCTPATLDDIFLRQYEVAAR